jgi:hypothetical protein
VTVHIWDDEKFLALSDDSKLIFLRLLTGPETTLLPGVVEADELSLSRAFLKPSDSLSKVMPKLLERATKATQEIEKEEMLVRGGHRLIWLPNGWRHNLPASPNVVVSWRTNWNNLPDNSLKPQILWSLAQATLACSKPYQEAFRKAFESLPEEVPNPFDRDAEGLPNKHQLAASSLQHQHQHQHQPIEKKSSEPPPAVSEPTPGSEVALVEPEVFSPDGALVKPNGASSDIVFVCKVTPHSKQETYSPTEADIEEWSRLFPHVDVPKRVARIARWGKDSPSKRKTHGGWPKSISKWLEEDEEKACKRLGIGPPGSGGHEKPLTQAQKTFARAQEARAREQGRGGDDR